MLKKLLLAVILFSLVPAALAATNCNPPVGSDWLLNSTNTPVVCDNGTAVNLSSYSLVLSENATVTFSNATNLTAGNITVSNASSSLTIENLSSTNATIRLSAGNVTLRNGAQFTTSPTITGGRFTLTNTTLLLASDLLINGAVANFTGATLNFTAGGIAADQVATLVFNDFVFNSTLTLYNGTLAYSNSLLGDPAIGNTYNIYAYNSTAATLTNITGPLGVDFNDFSTGTVNDSDLNAVSVADDGAANVIDSSLQSFTLITGQPSLNLTRSNVSVGFQLAANYTLRGFGANNFESVQTVEFNTLTVDTGIIIGNFSINGSANVTFLGAGGDSVTRVYPLYLVNGTGAPVASRIVKVLSNLSNASSAVWTGTSDAGGFLEPNITFNSTTYNDTFYLYVAGYTAAQNATLLLLNDTPLNWTIDTLGPSFNLTAQNTTVLGNTFSFAAALPSDAVRLDVRIHNATTTWTNSTVAGAGAAWNSTGSYEGIYLPVGNWTLNLTAYDPYNNTYAANQTFSSEAAILATLASSASQSATIGGSAVSFTFNVTAKGAGSTVKAYLVLGNGALTYNSAYARLRNSTANATVGSDGNYAGAEGVSMAAVTSWPSGIALNLTTEGTIRNELLVLSITPYSGLSAGTYTGSYGFGAFG